MRRQTRIFIVLAGLMLAAAPAAQGDTGFGVPNNCTAPTTGTNTAGNRPCWVAGVYNGDYTGMDDTNYDTAPGGALFTASGGHPFTAVTDFEVATTQTGTSPNVSYQPIGSTDGVSKVRVDVPPGVIADPQAVPQCPQPSSGAPLNCNSTQSPSNPSGSQLGVVLAEVYGSIPGSGQGGNLYVGASVYNMDPGGPKGPCGSSGLPYASDFAFQTVAGLVQICGGIRSGSEDAIAGTSADDGQYFTIILPPPGPSGATPLVRSTLIFWGNPQDPAHTPDWGWSCPLSPSPCGPSQCQFNTAASPSGACNASSNAAFLPQSRPELEQPTGDPFISLPSGCVPAGQVTTVSLWDDSGPPFAAKPESQTNSTTPVAATGCNKVPFGGSLSITPDSTQADEPTGATIHLQIPKQANASTPAESLLQSSVVTLPPGMTLSPSAANGLEACSPDQFNKSSDSAPTCPAASQIGTVEIDSPLVGKSDGTLVPLKGYAYLGCDGSEPTPCPSSDGLSDLYVYATASDFGLVQKLVGVVTADPSTGQVTTTFTNLPQEPFTDFILKLKGGATAPLANPLDCGTATMTSTLTPSSGNAAATPTSSFKVNKSASGGTCSSPAPFSPSMSWSAETMRAGAFDNALTVTFSRADGDQYLSTIAVQMPPGLVGLIPTVALCQEPAASQGTCGDQSQIGTVTVLAGSGSDPVTQTGNVYLTGPYAGAPFGLSIVVPAIAGPFNLGNVVTRAAINVDKNDAHLTVISSLPSIVDGVPLRIRSASVTINKPDFLINPTSCQPLAIGAIMSSTDGAGSLTSNPFQMGSCAALPFAPTLHMALRGNRRQMIDGGHPTLVATFRSTLGQANVRDTTVTLPLTMALDPMNAQHVCSVAGSQRDQCPSNSLIGNAVVQTPLLNTPLSGPVYLVQGIRTNSKGQQIRTLPTLLVELRGQVAIDLRAKTSVDSASRLVTTFANTPDASFSSFVLTITGGRRGILVVTNGANVCRGPQIAPVHLVAQTGKTEDFKVRMSTPCRPSWVPHKKRHKHHKKSRRRTRAHRSSVGVALAW